MVASYELPYFKGQARQRGRGFGALAQTLGRTAIPFLAKYVLPAAKRIGTDLLTIAAPEVEEVISGRKKFKSAAKDVGKRTLRKQLGAGKRKKRAISKRRKPANSRSRRDLFKKLEI